MRCSYCGEQFTEDEAVRACQSCPVSGCRMIKCPKCGYEMPPEPKLVKLFRRWFKLEDK